MITWHRLLFSFKKSSQVQLVLAREHFKSQCLHFSTNHLSSTLYNSCSYIFWHWHCHWYCHCHYLWEYPLLCLSCEELLLWSIDIYVKEISKLFTLLKTNYCDGKKHLKQISFKNIMKCQNYFAPDTFNINWWIAEKIFIFILCVIQRQKEAPYQSNKRRS